MCHCRRSRPAPPPVRSFPSPVSDRPEHDEPHGHHAHHDRGERRGYFMAHRRPPSRLGSVRRSVRAWASDGRCVSSRTSSISTSRRSASSRGSLNDLKTERAQAEVDDRRSLAEFADAVAGGAFDAAKAAGAGERRVQSAARMRETLTRALEQIHALLNLDQRQRLAYLIRTGVLII